MFYFYYLGMRITLILNSQYQSVLKSMLSLKFYLLGSPTQCRTILPCLCQRFGFHCVALQTHSMYVVVASSVVVASVELPTDVVLISMVVGVGAIVLCSSHPHGCSVEKSHSPSSPSAVLQ